MKAPINVLLCGLCAVDAALLVLVPLVLVLPGMNERIRADALYKVSRTALCNKTRHSSASLYLRALFLPNDAYATELLCVAHVRYYSGTIHRRLSSIQSAASGAFGRDFNIKCAFIVDNESHESSRELRTVHLCLLQFRAFLGVQRRLRREVFDSAVVACQRHVQYRVLQLDVCHYLYSFL